MSSMFAAVLVAAIPPVVVVGLLRLSERLQRRRDARRARQIELTDAIHREMGGGGRSDGRETPGRRLAVRMMVPLHDPEFVAAILTVTDQVFARHDRAGGADRSHASAGVRGARARAGRDRVDAHGPATVADDRGRPVTEGSMDSNLYALEKQVESKLRDARAAGARAALFSSLRAETRALWSPFVDGRHAIGRGGSAAAAHVRESVRSLAPSPPCRRRGRRRATERVRSEMERANIAPPPPPKHQATAAEG